MEYKSYKIVYTIKTFRKIVQTFCIKKSPKFNEESLTWLELPSFAALSQKNGILIQILIENFIFSSIYVGVNVYFIFQMLWNQLL